MFLHSFKPIVYEEAEHLILGSFPSVKSRALNFYYMHPQNRFWKILSSLYQMDFVNASIDEKIDLLKRCKIALYDVVESCDIINSSDSTISNITVVDVDALIHKTAIRNIYLNGQIAFKLFKKYHPHCQIPIHLLPSSSPANAKSSLLDLIDSWKKILI